LLTLSAVAFRLYRQKSAIREGASVLLAEAVNDTGDPELSAVTAVLRNGLAESAYFNLVEQSKVRETLQEMSKPPDLPLTPEITREVAWRAGANATVFGTVSRLGADYLLSVRFELTGGEPQSPAGHWTKQ